jgi:hypothetical protein
MREVVHKNEERRFMALHPDFPRSPYEELSPDLRWFPAAEELRSTAYESLARCGLCGRIGHVERPADLVVRD